MGFKGKGSLETEGSSILLRNFGLGCIIETDEGKRGLKNVTKWLEAAKLLSKNIWSQNYSACTCFCVCRSSWI